MARLHILTAPCPQCGPSSHVDAVVIAGSKRLTLYCGVCRTDPITPDAVTVQTVSEADAHALSGRAADAWMAALPGADELPAAEFRREKNNFRGEYMSRIRRINYQLRKAQLGPGSAITVQGLAVRSVPAEV